MKNNFSFFYYLRKVSTMVGYYRELKTKTDKIVEEILEVLIKNDFDLTMSEYMLDELKNNLKLMDKLVHEF